MVSCAHARVLAQLKEGGICEQDYQEATLVPVDFDFTTAAFQCRMRIVLPLH